MVVYSSVVRIVPKGSRSGTSIVPGTSSYRDVRQRISIGASRTSGKESWVQEVAKVSNCHNLGHMILIVWTGD